MKSLKSRLEESYRVATHNASKVAEQNKKQFDRNVNASALEPGDRVLVRNVKLRGKHKLSDKWESEIYVVLRKAGDMPVYTVCPEGKDGPVRTLHRDLLLPCGFLPVSEIEESDPPKMRSKPRTRSHSANEAAQQEPPMSSQSDSEDDPVHTNHSGLQLDFSTKTISPFSGSPLFVETLPETNSIESPPDVVNPAKENLPDTVE